MKLAGGCSGALRRARNFGGPRPLWLVVMRRVRLLLLAPVFAGLIAASAMAAPAPQFGLHPRKLPYELSSYPIVSGNYALLSLSQPYNTYVLIDDQTDTQTKIVPPGGSGCQLWANAFGVPWLLFYCGGPTLYNIHTRRWTALPCGEACENTGVAAPGAIGSHWVEIDENAYCDSRYDPCSTPDAFVALPSGKTGSYTPSSHTLLDLNSPSLSQTICAPWSSADVSAIDGQFVAVAEGTEPGVARCGSSTVLPVVPGTSEGFTETDHLMSGCPLTPTPSGGGVSGPREGVFLPSLERFTMTLPASFQPCTGELDDEALYVWSERPDRVWRAQLPTGPLPTYRACPRTSTVRLQSTNPNAYQRLVPAGADQVLLCRYGPLPGRRLRSQRLISSQSAVSRLARALNRLPTESGIRSCVFDNGTSISAFFRYPALDDVPVTVQLTGCATVTNRHLRRAAFTRAGEATVRYLERLF